MNQKLRLKPSVKEIAEVFFTGVAIGIIGFIRIYNYIHSFVFISVAIGIIGFIIASMMSARFHSLENDPRFYEQKKTEMSGIQISQK